MERPRRLLPSGRRLSGSAVGIVGSVLIHGFLALPLVLDLSLPAPPVPNRSGVGATSLVSDSEPTIAVFFFDDTSAPKSQRKGSPIVLASRGRVQHDLPILVLSADGTPATKADSNSKHSADYLEATDDQMQRALLYGRYLGQVQARIERAWVRPRSEIGAPTFACRAHISQDRNGDITGLKLESCNGTQRWQQSLVSAIRTASPLPAPPDPSVYSDSLWLSFNSVGFNADAASEGFEPESPANRIAAELEKSGKVFHLTIIGTPSALHGGADLGNTPAEEPSANIAQEPPTLP